MTAITEKGREITSQGAKRPSANRGLPPIPEPHPVRDRARTMSVTRLPQTGRDIKNGVAVHCLALLKKHLGNFPFQAAENSWQKAVQELKDFFSAPFQEGEDENARRKLIQKRLCELLKDPAYQEFKHDEQNLYTQFVHLAAEIIHNQSEGMSVFEAYGRQLLRDSAKPENTYRDLFELLQQAVAASSDASVDSIADRLLTHAAKHPVRALATFISERAAADGMYNPYDTGNYNSMLGYYRIGDAEVGSSAGPNPSHPDYAIFAAIHQRNENLECRTRHLQVVLEGAEKKPGAKARKESIIEMQDQHKALSTMALPLDGDAWKGKGDFSGLQTAKEFLGFILKLEDDTHIPTSISTQLIHRATGRFVEAFRTLEGTPVWRHLQENGQLSKTLLLGFNALMILAGLESLAHRPEKFDVNGLIIRSTCNIACKQGIDRGAIQNLAIRMLVDANARKKFTVSDEELYQYCGYIAGRAVSVEARRIQKDRFEALLNFTALLGSASPDQQRAFLAALNLPADMRFIPSRDCSLA